MIGGGVLTTWPARTHNDSLSMVSLRRITLSSMRVIVTSSSDGLGINLFEDSERTRAIRTYRPASYSLDAIGETSECMLMMPSYGRSGGGRTSRLSMCAMTLLASREMRETRRTSTTANEKRRAGGRTWFFRARPRRSPSPR